MAEYQAHLFTGRYRKVRALEPSELQIQIALVARLRLLCKPGVIFYAVPNGELRDKQVAAKLKACGVRPGVSDLVFDIAGQAPLYLELKTRRGRQSEAQQEFQREVQAIGRRYEIANSIDEAVRILQDYGILP